MSSKFIILTISIICTFSNVLNSQNYDASRINALFKKAATKIYENFENIDVTNSLG